MPVDQEIQGILDFIESRNVPKMWEVSPPEARENMSKARAIFFGPTVELARVENRIVPGPAGEIPVRIYAASTGKPLPVLVYYHGGGWVIGDLESHDDACRHLARDSGCLVISVDYRLAPEHPFPAAVEDAWAALQWIAAHAGELGGDGTRLAVGGDSAGGNLSAVVTQFARDQGGPALSFQLLVYPGVDCDQSRSSFREHGGDYILRREAVDWFLAHYIPDVETRADPRFSPIRAKSLAGLPPALVILAPYDVLLDEGEDYAKKLKAAGVPVTVKHYPGAIHAFFTMSVTAVSRQALADAAAALKTALKA